MGRLIGELLPLAIGIALSITTVIATVLMLLSARAKSRTVGLLLGCVLGVAGVVALVAFLASSLPAQELGPTSPVGAWIQIVVGVLLAGLALRQWCGRSAGDEPAVLPRWMAGVDSMGPVKALLLGLLLSAVVPKNLLLAVSAGVIVGEARSGPGRSAAVVGVFTAIAISTVAVPVIAHLVAPARMHGPLERLREWLVAHNVVIMVVVLLAIGLYMIAKGIASL
jgi:threonine/homoserine/homoserine lactone efflux protein